MPDWRWHPLPILYSAPADSDLSRLRVTLAPDPSSDKDSAAGERHYLLTTSLRPLFQPGGLLVAPGGGFVVLF
jgi:hypothetical protein